MHLIKFPNPILLKRCEEVSDFGQDLKNTMEEMYVIMENHGGIGLSANQVGLSKRMFVMKGKNNEKLFLVNPTVTDKSKISIKFKEGCLSAPEEFVLTDERSMWVRVKYQSPESGESKIVVLDNALSVCAQHEMDHLDGISFLQLKSIPSSIRNKLARKWGLKC